MQQRELRLGDILDDYCPRERRLTNHAIVAMVDQDVKQTRCTTCDTEHEYKHAKVPRQRRKSEAPAALYAQVAAGAPKRVGHEATDPQESHVADEEPDPVDGPLFDEPASDVAEMVASPADESVVEDEAEIVDEPVHRPLIRATLPRIEGQAPPARPAPDFTIRQPTGRPGRFRARPQQRTDGFQGNRSNGSNGNVAGGPPRGGMPRHNGGRPQGVNPRMARRQDFGRKRSK